jgi:hypothetical protein
LIVEVPTVLTRIDAQLRVQHVEFPWSFYLRWLDARYPRRMFMRRGFLRP